MPRRGAKDLPPEFVPSPDDDLAGYEMRPAPDFADPATRHRLSRAAANGMARLVKRWKLTDAEACGLLGGISELQWAKIDGGWDSTFSEDEMTRISALLGIFKGLHMLFSEPLDDTWVNRPNTGTIFGGQRPIDFMIKGGTSAILTTRRYIDAVCQGY